MPNSKFHLKIDIKTALSYPDRLSAGYRPFFANEIEFNKFIHFVRKYFRDALLENRVKIFDCVFIPTERADDCDLTVTINEGFAASVAQAAKDFIGIRTH